MVALLLIFFVAATFALALTPLVASAGLRIGVVDHPGWRRVHTVVMPRVGGAAIALALTATLGLVMLRAPLRGLGAAVDFSTLTPVLAGAVLVFLVGLLDDIFRLAVWQKLLGQTLAAVFFASVGNSIQLVSLFGHTFELGLLGLPLTVVWILVVTNAFNLVDGVDGLACGLACIAASTCAALLIARGDYAEGVLLIAFVGAMIGFLPYNMNPAEVFLGDSGSLLCGFLLATTAISGRQKGATALAVVVPLLIFALPLFETVFSAVRRFVKGQRRPGLSLFGRVRALAHIVQADQDHLHHRLMAMGLSHRRSVLLLHGVALVCAALALVTAELP